MPDLFIALKVHDDVWADESELHLGQPEDFRDLFDLMQPRAHLENLLCAYMTPLRLEPHRIQLYFRVEGRRGRWPLTDVRR